MLASLAEALHRELREIAANDRLRTCPPTGGNDRARPTLAGVPVVSFCSNDYLGLANHPALAAAAATAATSSGFGAGAARLVSGDLFEHRALERALAAFLASPSALLFPSGYQANLGVLTALAGRDDLIVSDAANHASIIDGCRLSRAEVAVFPHRDAHAARALLAATGRRHRRRFLVTESLFSMDGDVAPLADLAEICRDHDVGLVVDEAHALGALGPGGTGLCAAAGLQPDVLVGTLGKSFGAHGGFVVGTEDLRAYLVNRARTFIFTTAAPAPVAAAALTALELAAGPAGDERRRSLAARVASLAEALGRDRATPIVPFVLGADNAALAASARLRERGLFVQAIRPPTVPPGTARLRITLSATHRPEDVDRLARALAELRP